MGMAESNAEGCRMAMWCTSCEKGYRKHSGIIGFVI